MPAGYSRTPLVKKLGYKPGMRVIYVNAPAHYEDLLGGLPGNVDVRARLVGKFDLIHFFTTKLRFLCAVDEDWSGLKFVIRKDAR